MLVTISATVDPRSAWAFRCISTPRKCTASRSRRGAHVFCPEATARRSTAALLLDVDPVALVRGAPGQAAESFTRGQYVDDRPYAASRMRAVALSKVFKTAMTSQCDARPQLAATLALKSEPVDPRL